MSLVSAIVGFVTPSPLGVAVGEVWGSIQRGDRRKQAAKWAQERAVKMGLPLIVFGPGADLNVIQHPGPAVVVVDEALCRAPDLDRAWNEVLRVAGNDLNNVFVIHSQPWSWYHRLAPGIRNKIESAPPYGPWIAKPYPSRPERVK